MGYFLRLLFQGALILHLLSIHALLAGFKFGLADLCELFLSSLPFITPIGPPSILPHSQSIICSSAIQWIVVFGYYHISCLLRSLQFYQLHVVMVKVGEWFIDQLE